MLDALLGLIFEILGTIFFLSLLVGLAVCFLLIWLGASPGVSVGAGLAVWVCGGWLQVRTGTWFT